MEMIALMLSGLALLAAGVCLYLLVQEKKRNQERNAAMLNYVGIECEAVSKAAGAYADKLFAKLAGEITELENRTDPEAIRRAAEEIVVQAVNDVCEKIAEPYSGQDFGLGINNIMNFDPRESMVRQREKGKWVSKWQER